MSMNHGIYFNLDRFPIGELRWRDVCLRINAIVESANGLLQGQLHFFHLGDNICGRADGDDVADRLVHL